jgi:hypothetical protein
LGVRSLPLVCEARSQPLGGGFGFRAEQTIYREHERGELATPFQTSIEVLVLFRLLVGG